MWSPTDEVQVHALQQKLNNFTFYMIFMLQTAEPDVYEKNGVDLQIIQIEANQDINQVPDVRFFNKNAHSTSTDTAPTNGL